MSGMCGHSGLQGAKRRACRAELAVGSLVLRELTPTWGGVTFPQRVEEF